MFVAAVGALSQRLAVVLFIISPVSLCLQFAGLRTREVDFLVKHYAIRLSCDLMFLIPTFFIPRAESLCLNLFSDFCVKAQALNSIMEQEQPDYDMDSEDERWMKDSKKRAGLEVTHLQFEEMIDRLEKSCGNQVKMLQIGFAFLSLSIPMIPEIKKSCGFVW